MEKQQRTRRVSFFPTTYSSSQAVSVPGHCALPVLWSLTFLPEAARALMGSLGTRFMKQIPLLFGRVSGQDLFLGP